MNSFQNINHFILEFKWQNKFFKNMHIFNLVVSYCCWHVLNFVRPQGHLQGRGPKQWGAAGLLTGSTSACSRHLKHITPEMWHDKCGSEEAQRNASTVGSWHTALMQEVEFSEQTLKIIHSRLQFCPDTNAKIPTARLLHAWRKDIYCHAPFVRWRRNMFKMYCVTSCVKSDSMRFN